MSEQEDQPSDDVTSTPTAPSTPPAAAPALVRRERSAGFGAMRVHAIVVALATLVPAVALVVLSPAEGRDDVAIVDDDAPASVDTAAVRAALDDVGARLDEAAAANSALLARAVDAERGNRLRLLGRAVARARDTRRAAGLAGPDLKSPFPANELGDVAALGFGPRRWLIARDGSAVIVPAGVTVPATLATTGRDEDPLALAASGDVPALVRRCLPNEGYCIVDVESTVAAAAPVSLDAVRASLATLSSPPAATTKDAGSTTTTTTTTRSSTTRSSTVPVVIALLAAIAGAFVAWRLWNVGALVRRRGWRLRAGVARSAEADGGLAELRELDDAIDDAIARLGDGAVAADVQRRRRERLQVIGAALDDARDRGGVPRVDADEDDDVALAAVAFSVNALLDVLDARATRMKLALDDVDGALKVLTPLAQRLLRLARLPDLPAQAVDELTSLGTALGQRARRVGSLPALLDEAGRLAPASSDVIARADALRALPGDEALRLGISAQRGEGAGNASEPERPVIG